MEDLRNNTFSEREIEELIVELQPIFDQILEKVRENNIKGFVQVTTWDDGTVFFSGSGLGGWSIERDSEGYVSIRYNYEKKLAKEGVKKA